MAPGTRASQRMKAAESKSTVAAGAQKATQPFLSEKAEEGFFGRKADSESTFFKPAAFRRGGRSSVLQTKLTVGRPNDIYEKQADAMADKVVQRLAAPSVIQPKCAECEHEKELQNKEEEREEGDLSKAKRLQKKPIFESNAEPPDEDDAIHLKCSACEREERLQASGGTAPLAVAPNTESSLMASKGSGATLPSSTREQMESSFGTDFSNVRIHTGSDAVKMSKDLHAQAFTHGNDIYFNSGKYDPASRSGKHLLAHELTHTVQQGKAGSARRRIQRVPDWLSGAADWVTSTASSVADDVVSDAQWVGGQVNDGAQWVGNQVSAGADWVGDQVSAAAQWLIGQIRGAIDSGTSYLTEQWQHIQDFGRTCFDDIKKGFGALAGLITTPFSGFMSALSAMNADLAAGAWSLLKTGVGQLWSGINSVINGVLAIGQGIWDAVAGSINGIFDTISGLFDNEAFRLLPDAIQSEARSLFDGLRTLWNQVSTFWTDLWQRLTSSVQEILTAVRSFTENVIGFSIDRVIAMVRNLKEVYDFFTRLFADPHGTIQPILDQLAAKLNAEAPGRSTILGNKFAQENYPHGSGQPAPDGTIQREPEDSEDRTTATLAEVGKGIVYYIARSWAELDIKKMLWDTVVNMFWPPATIRAIFAQFSQLWNDDWATTVDSLYRPRNFFDDPLGCLEDIWSNFLILLDFPLALWRTLNNVAGLLMGYVSIIIILGEAIAGGVAAVEVGVVPGILAGAAAGLATVASIGEALMASFVAAESATVITVLVRLYTARQLCEKRQVDILTAVASFVAMAVALILQVLMAILSELVTLIADFLKGVPEGAPVPQPQPVPQPVPQPAPAPAPAGPAGGGNVIPFPTRPAPVTPSVPGQVAAKFEGDPGVAPSTEPSDVEVSANGVLQLVRKDRIDPDACKKGKKICYEKSVTFSLTDTSMNFIGINETPDDLRIPACVTRTATGTTVADFRARNIAVGKFLVGGTFSYIPAANIPHGLHSEDVILIAAKKQFGEGNYKLAALFSERVPCYTCGPNLKGTPKTNDCKVYCIINNDYNWAAIRRSYNDGVLV